MIIRIVRMTFREEVLPQFDAMFARIAPSIRSFAGCRRLELWEDADEDAVRTTFSLWESTDALARYRDSPLFRDTWSRTRKLFAAAPTATSYRLLREDPKSRVTDN
jgi:heme-degrading monooxygenase HmoA